MSEIKDNILTEWLAQDSNCYKSYMKLKGFIDIARTFKSGHEITFSDENISKACKVKPENVRSLLVQLGKFRKFALNKLFNLALQKVAYNNKINPKEIQKNHFFIEAGSTNVTSDYDITISGPYCSEVIEYMFEIYFDQFGTVLPVGFDSNLYPGTASYTTVDGLHEDFKKPSKNFLKIKLKIGDYGEKEMLLSMVTNTPQGDSTLQNYQWACSKLYDALSSLKDSDHEVETPHGFKSFLEHGQKISDICRERFCNQLVDKGTNKRGGGESNAALDSEVNSLHKSYEDMWEHGKHLDAYYREGSNSKLPHERIDLPETLKQYVNTPLGYSNLVAWLCSEAYYSSFTVYAIVVSLQLGYPGAGFIKDVWLVAVIENLADLIKHMLHTISHSEEQKSPGVVEEVEYKKMYITYSKYYYRIYYCLTKYEEFTGIDFGVDASVKLSSLDKALDRRKDFNIELANKDNIWGPECLNITNIRKPREWLKETTIFVMNILNKEFGASIVPGVGGKRKRKTRKGKHSKKRKKRKRKNRSKKRRSRQQIL
jgi:hypothetical protein